MWSLYILRIKSFPFQGSLYVKGYYLQTTYAAAVNIERDPINLSVDTWIDRSRVNQNQRQKQLDKIY